MPVPSAISDLSTTPALNSPAGSESPALVDDYLRTYAAFIKQVSDSVVGKVSSADLTALENQVVKLTGNQTIAGVKTLSSAPISGNGYIISSTGWSVIESAGTLYFAHNGVNKAKLDSSGNLTVAGNVTAFGTI